MTFLQKILDVFPCVKYTKWWYECKILHETVNHIFQILNSLWQKEVNSYCCQVSRNTPTLMQNTLNAGCETAFPFLQNFVTTSETNFQFPVFDMNKWAGVFMRCTLEEQKN